MSLVEYKFTQQNTLYSVCDQWSVFSLNRIHFIEFTSFYQVIYFGFIQCEGKCLFHQHVGIVENFILNKIILFGILFYSILFNMML